MVQSMIARSWTAPLWTLTMLSDITLLTDHAQHNSHYSDTENAAYCDWLNNWPDPTDPAYQRVELQYADGSDESLQHRYKQKEHKIRAKRHKPGNIDLLRL